MASRNLNDLAPAFRPFVVEFLARLAEARIPVVVVETLRTQVEHEANVKAGKSWTSHSKHIDGLAIDIAPIKTLKEGRASEIDWDSLQWPKIGEIGEACGLKWGGRWKQKDYCHFEMPSTGGAV